MGLDHKMTFRSYLKKYILHITVKSGCDKIKSSSK